MGLYCLLERRWNKVLHRTCLLSDVSVITIVLPYKTVLVDTILQNTTDQYPPSFAVNNLDIYSAVFSDCLRGTDFLAPSVAWLNSTLSEKDVVMAATAERSCLWNVCMPLLCTGIVMGTKITSWKTHRHQIIQVEALSTFLDAWPCTRSKPGEKGGRCSMSSRGCLKRSKGSINNAQTIDFA